MPRYVTKYVFHYSLAITCEAPTIANAVHNCGDGPIAWDGSCDATCGEGFYGDTKITCNVDNEDGTGSFDETSICTGIHFLLLIKM